MTSFSLVVFRDKLFSCDYKDKDDKLFSCGRALNLPNLGPIFGPIPNAK